MLIQMTTRDARKLQTRAAVLAAARTVLARHGLRGTTTRAVAEEARVAIGTVFLHFPDVDHLVEALLDAHLDLAVRKATRAARGRGGLVGDLVLVARVLFESYDVEPDLSRAFLAASLFGGTPGGLAEARLVAFEGWVGQRIAAAVQAGEVPPVEPLLAFSTYFSLYFGALVAGLRGQLTRRQQLRLLDAALHRFFLGEAP
jgi:AcrR family transcriptional regulator